MCCCIEEIAWRNKWIKSEDLVLLASSMKENDYGKYLQKLVETQQ
jgi:glucose-1-phosphate thymidylyltransferase